MKIKTAENVLICQSGTTTTFKTDSSLSLNLELPSVCFKCPEAECNQYWCQLRTNLLLGDPKQDLSSSLANEPEFCGFP